jgi:hypothetical protein
MAVYREEIILYRKTMLKKRLKRMTPSREAINHQKVDFVEIVFHKGRTREENFDKRKMNPPTESIQIRATSHGRRIFRERNKREKRNQMDNQREAIKVRG